MAKQRSNRKSKKRNKSYIPSTKEQAIALNRSLQQEFKGSSDVKTSTGKKMADTPTEGEFNKNLNDGLPDELVDQIDLGGSNDVGIICDPIQHNAFEANTTGNDFKHKSIGWMVCWLVFASLSDKFLAHAFRFFSKKSEDYLFNNTARLCLVLDVDKQSSTILKYGKAIKHYYLLYKDEITLENYETIAAVIANKMKLDGGFLQFETAKGRRGGGTGTRLTKAKFEERVTKVKEKPHITSFKSATVKPAKSNLVLFLGHCEAGNIDLVQTITDEELIKYVIRNLSEIDI